MVFLFIKMKQKNMDWIFPASVHRLFFLIMIGMVTGYVPIESFHSSEWNFWPRKDLLAVSNPLSGDRLYRNDRDKKFTDVTKEVRNT